MSIKTIHTISILIWLLPLSKVSNAQTQVKDSLTLSLPQVEQLFIENNFDLLLQQSEISKAKAELITAKLFDNPEFSHENLFYNHETKRFLETSYASGQYQTQVSQLIKLAGKRNKNIKVAQSGIKMAEYEYYDLLRILRFELRSVFYQTFYLQKSLSVYKLQIESLKQLLKSTTEQVKLGNSANKDLVRIKSLLYNLQAELNEKQNNLEELHGQLRMFINTKPEKYLKLILPNHNQVQLSKITYMQLLDSAKLYRADMNLAREGIEYAGKNLKLQRAMAIPDVEFSLSYDLKGNYPEKYTGIGVRLPIPLFNRNQGEIKKAHLEMSESFLQMQKQELVVETEVYTSYENALRTERMFESLDSDFNQVFEQLIAQVFKNFQQKNIGLLEFLDFYESYKENTFQMNNISLNRAEALEKLNYVTGTSIF